MDPCLKIELNKVKNDVLETIKTNRNTTEDTLLKMLKLNYPNVNTFHLRYKLSKAVSMLKNENKIQEIEKQRIDFGQNIHLWAQNICLIDLNIIQCLKALDQCLRNM
jgi:hypothetical protein